MLRTQTELVENIKSGVLRKFPLLGATMTKLKFEPLADIDTAATDGQKVYYNEVYLKSLPFDKQVFLFSHEVMHVAMDHLVRSKGKDMNIWNIATDSVINQLLVNEKLPMIDGGIDMPEALKKSADEMYEKLYKANQENQSQNAQSQNAQSQNQSGQQSGQQQGHAGHEMWEVAVKIADKQNAESNGQEASGLGINSQVNKSEQNQNNNGKGNNNDKSDLEKQFADLNKKLKEEIGKKIREKLKEQSHVKQAGKNEGCDSFSYGNVGSAKAAVSWKKVLKRELEKEEDRWSYRRANEENDYQARIGSMEVYDHPHTEVMLDTSGSINEDLLRNFLRQLKPLLKESKIFVGCFDTKFYGFKEIKTKKDIDNLTLRGRGGTDFDTAVKSFSKDNKINKIIFTDGEDMLTNNEENNKVKKLYWVVFDNNSFKPCNGKVINVRSRDIQNIDYCNDELSL